MTVSKVSEGLRETGGFTKTRLAGLEALRPGPSLGRACWAQNCRKQSSQAVPHLRTPWQMWAVGCRGHWGPRLPAERGSGHRCAHMDSHTYHPEAGLCQGQPVGIWGKVPIPTGVAEERLLALRGLLLCTLGSKTGECSPRARGSGTPRTGQTQHPEEDCGGPAPPPVGLGGFRHISPPWLR